MYKDTFFVDKGYVESSGWYWVIRWYLTFQIIFISFPWTYYYFIIIIITITTIIIVIIIVDKHCNWLS